MSSSAAFIERMHDAVGAHAVRAAFWFDLPKGTRCIPTLLVLYWILREGRIQSAERAVPTLNSLRTKTNLLSA
jgi:hypothetical protein